MGKNNIVLIGYRCSGKSTVGKILATDLDKDFHDTDLMIEILARCTIEEIILNKGWASFRSLEKEVVRDISGKEDCVVATGGGVVMDQENVKNIRRNGFVVWLKGDPEVLRERMHNDRNSGSVRPSLTNTHPADEIAKVLETRIPYYRKAGDIELDTSLLSTRDVADLILNNLVTV